MAESLRCISTRIKLICCVVLRAQKSRGTLSYISASFSRGYLKLVSESCCTLLQSNENEALVCNIFMLRLVEVEECVNRCPWEWSQPWPEKQWLLIEWDMVMLIAGLLTAPATVLDNSQVCEISSLCLVFRIWVHVTESFKWAAGWDFIFSAASMQMILGPRPHTDPALTDVVVFRRWGSRPTW